jgi:hypothetical protein
MRTGYFLILLAMPWLCCAQTLPAQSNDIHVVWNETVSLENMTRSREPWEMWITRNRVLVKQGPSTSLLALDVQKSWTWDDQRLTEEALQTSVSPSPIQEAVSEAGWVYRPEYSWSARFGKERIYREELSGDSPRKTYSPTRRVFPITPREQTPSSVPSLWRCHLQPHAGIEQRRILVCGSALLLRFC